MSTTTDLQARLSAMSPGDVLELDTTIAYGLEGPVIPRPGTTILGKGATLYPTVDNWSMNNALIMGDLYGMGGVTVADMHIDCAAKSRMGATLSGQCNTFRNVHVVRHISTHEYESFALLIGGCVQENNVWIPCGGNLIEDCSATEFLGSYDGGLVIGDPHALIEGTIRRSRVVGNDNADGAFVGCIGASLVEHCVVENASLGCYTEGGLTEMVFRFNRVINVRRAGAFANLYAPQQKLVIQGNYISLASAASTGIETAGNPDKLLEIAILGNVIVGAAGMWCRLNGVHAEIRDNQIDPALTNMVQDCTGEASHNRSRDGKWSTKDGPLKKKWFPGGQSQLRTIPLAA